MSKQNQYSSKKVSILFLKITQAKILPRFVGFLIILFGSFNYSVAIAQTSENVNISRDVKPTKECLETISINWTDVEKWVWKKLCNGEDALLDKYQTERERKTGETSQKEISPNFIKTILSDANFTKILPRKILIQNGVITKKLDLSSANIDKELHLEKFIFAQDVTFAKAKISESIYFDNSTFKKTLAINEAVVNGNIFMRKVEFSNYQESKIPANEEIIFINLRGTKVDSSINLKDAKICHQEFLNRKFNLPVYGLSASKAQVNNSIVMDNSKFYSCEVQLDSVKVEQSIVFNINTKFQRMNLNNAQINTLLIKIPDDANSYINQLKLLEILKDDQETFNALREKITKIVNQDDSNNTYEIIKFIFIQKIILEDVNAKTFQIDSQKSQDKILPELNLKSQMYAEKNNSEELKQCELEIDGFGYQNINNTALNILGLCLNSIYENEINNHNKNSPENNNNQTIIKLFQPLEQAAKASRNLGRYDLEREFLYQRKKLEIYIAPNVWEKYILMMQDFMYGFGYQRNKILYFFLLIWSPGFFLAYFQLQHKQKMILNNVCKIVEQEKEDEEIQAANIVEIKKVAKYIDSVQEVIFCGSLEKSIVNNDKIRVPFAVQKDQDAKKLWLNILIITLIPTSSILFATYISFYGSLIWTILPCCYYVLYKLFKCNQKVEIKDVKSEIFITFKDENNKDEQLFYTNKVMGIQNHEDEYSISVKSQDEKNKSKQLLSLKKSPQDADKNIYFRLNLTLDDQDSFLGENQKDAIIDFIERLDVRNPRNRKIGFCDDLFPESKLFLLYFQTIKTHNGTQQIVCFYDADKDLFYVEDGKRILLWRLWQSAIFSLDILLPLVELDPELHKFIFDDSEGLTRAYFTLQKILATIIASVLLPVLFITGL
ncbi:hypothetical protein WJM97_18155 [Okeanomitos corallinicola TIOX110]|uniref:Transmembrane protein n=1 Tax=Okeanomitos corallinicola TIOX110 TaxID=3133117 RepID=A0ABZ2UPS7_9CYAN